MASESRDISVRTIDPLAFPSLTSRVVDIQPNPLGGYFVLMTSEPAAQSGAKILLLSFDEGDALVWSKSYVVFAPKADPRTFQTTAASMSVGLSDIFITGTTSRVTFGPPIILFVMKLTIDGITEWQKVYDPFPVDGCTVPPAPLNCMARSIVRLPSPDEDKLMVLFQTAQKYNGSGAPAPDDVLGAAVMVIDNDGNVGQVTRLFGSGHAMPSRLRVLPSFGPTIVGRTRVVFQTPLPNVSNWHGWLARVDTTGAPVFETSYDYGNSPEVSNAVLNDVAEGPTAIITVGEREVRGLRTAIALRINDVGNTFWSAEYLPPVGVEFHATHLELVRLEGDAFIAAGSYYTDLVASAYPGPRPWLMQLDPDSPAPIWGKGYRVPTSNSSLECGFYAMIWRELEQQVLAGGNAMGKVTATEDDRIGILVLSESTATVDNPGCGTPAPVMVGNPPLLQGFQSLLMDRMPIGVDLWFADSEEADPVVVTVCSNQ